MMWVCPLPVESIAASHSGSEDENLVVYDGTAESLVGKRRGRGRCRGKTVANQGQECTVGPEIVTNQRSEKSRGRGRGQGNRTSCTDKNDSMFFELIDCFNNYCT